METAFVKAVEAIYTAAPEPTLWPAALQAIADCFDDVGGNLVWKRDDGELGVIVSDSLKLATEDYERKWWRYDIRSERAIERMIWARGDTICDRDTIKDHEITGHEFYTEFLAKHGLRWFACTGLCPDPRTAVGLAVQRSIHKSSFKESELDLLARLGKHAERSLRLTVRLLDAELTNVGLGDALSRLNIGVFALDSLGRVTFSNSAGERLLGDGITLVGGRLRIVASDQESANRSLLLLRESDDLDGADLKPILVPRSHSNRSLVVHVLPVPRVAQLQTAFLTHVSAIVLVINPDPAGPPDPAIVRDLLGLTLGEARVAALVGSGIPPAQAADRLGITEGTSRVTLKSVFAKLGISRQSQLAALLTKLVIR